MAFDLAAETRRDAGSCEPGPARPGPAHCGAGKQACQLGSFALLEPAGPVGLVA